MFYSISTHLNIWTVLITESMMCLSDEIHDLGLKNVTSGYT